MYRFIKFQYIFEVNRFEPIVLDTNLPYDDLRTQFTKLKTEDQRRLERIKFGECVVAVPYQTVFSLLVNEVLNPFYIF
jgi:cation-transporting ATPase 13A2